MRTTLENWKKTVEGVYANEGSNPAGEDRNLILCCRYPYPTQFNYQFEFKVVTISVVVVEKVLEHSSDIFGFQTFSLLLRCVQSVLL